MASEEAIQSARWIWCDRDVERQNQYALFRRRVGLSADRGRVLIHACADLRYWLYFNGRRIGFGPGRYNPRHPQYDTHDVTEWACAGENIVAFKVHAAGNVPFFVSATPVRAGLVAAVQWNGGKVVTDRTWRTAPDKAYAADTPRFSAHQSFIECFDSRVAVRDWQAPGFDDSAWPTAWEIPTDALSPWEQLAPRDVALLTLTPRTPARIVDYGLSIPLPAHDVERMEQLAEMLESAARSPAEIVKQAAAGLFPVEFAPPADGRSAAYAVFDFAENSAGYLAFEVEAAPGAILDFGYGEHLLDGRVPCFKQTIRNSDRFIAGEGVTSHQLMMPKTFRYLLVEVRRGRAVLRQLRQDVSTYPVRWRGGFTCDEAPELAQVWRIGAHTVQLCMEDIFVDTPWRERTGWLGDLLPEAMAAYYAFGETGLVRHSLDLFMSSQEPEGYLSGRYPTNLPSNMPTWSAAYGMALADYVRYSGDVGFARSMWDGMRRLTDWFERQRTAEDLLVVLPSKLSDKVTHTGWVLVDWAPMLFDGAVSAMNMYYCRYLQDAAWLAGLLGQAEESARLNALAERTRKAIQTRLFEDRRGVFVNCRFDGKLSRQAGCQENLLALLWDIATPQQAERILRAMLPDDRPLPLWHNPDQMNWAELANGLVKWESDDLVPIGSPFFEYFALGALFEIGRPAAAIRSIQAHYGGILACGATTLWEEWGGASSHSHGWGAAPTCFAGKYLLGVEPVTPGFRRFRVLPGFGHLRHAAGRVPTPHGLIAVEWRRESAGDWLGVLVPECTEALVGLPARDGAASLLCDGRPVKAEVVTLRRGRYLAATVPAGRHELELRRPS